jgi:hypothetical protein
MDVRLEGNNLMKFVDKVRQLNTAFTADDLEKICLQKAPTVTYNRLSEGIGFNKIVTPFDEQTNYEIHDLSYDITIQHFNAYLSIDRVKSKMFILGSPFACAGNIDDGRPRDIKKYCKEEAATNVSRLLSQLEYFLYLKKLDWPN